MDSKWKERKPEETIQLIKDFFETCGYQVKLWGNEETEAGTWHCSVDLYKDKQFILQTNGKGMTEAYSQASAYAELYERFCNKTNFIRIPSFVRNYTNLQEKVNGFKFHPGEKKLTYEDVRAVPNMAEQLGTLLGSKENVIRYLNCLVDREPVGEPYTNLATGETAYYDPRLVHFICASNGQAAGNTVEEALNQALSELTERMAERLFLETPQDIYYRINLNSITNPELQERIQRIEEAGNRLYVYDLSYNFGYPTIMSIIINNQMNITNVNFGSFPVFDIAFERTLTEIYQSNSHMGYYNGLQTPFKGNNLFNEFKNSLSGCACIPENCFLHYQAVDAPSEVFLTERRTNKELNQYFIDLFAVHAMDIYYIDHSLISDLAAVQVFIPQYRYMEKDMKQYRYASKIMIDNTLTFIETLNGIVDKIINGTYWDVEKDIQTALQCVSQPHWDGNYTGKLQFNDGLNILPEGNENTYLIFRFLGDCTLNGFRSIYWPGLQKIYTLNNYVSSGYSNQEIIGIFDRMFDISITNYDIENYNTVNYMITNVLLKPLVRYYGSPAYREILISFLYKGKSE